MLDPKKFVGLPEFVEEMETQDAMSTARPIIIELQVKEEVFVDPAIGPHDHVGKAGDIVGEDNCEDYGIPKDSLLYWKDVWVGKAWFLTWSGYEKHMEINGHNYKKDEVRPFVHYGGYRNPDIQDIFAWLKAMREELELPDTSRNLADEVIKFLAKLGDPDIDKISDRDIKKLKELAMEYKNSEV